MYLRMYNKDKKSCEKLCGLDPAPFLTSVSGSPFSTGATYVSYDGRSDTQGRKSAGKEKKGRRRVGMNVFQGGTALGSAFRRV